MATKTMTLKDYRKALGLSESQLAWGVQSLTGVSVPSDLIFEAERESGFAGERPKAPMAEVKAQAIAKFVSKEMNRTVSVEDLGLEVV